ncbi:MAG: PspC domain-containing protein [Bacteroidales bacterium]|jgi:phage shock protein PspC (stress-responsive transcriptional regulator)|nr:PspC domain-containing protein [Bacteroidales bacterium]
MKRVETITINGIVFNIDNDAYSGLRNYLDVLGKYFENEQGGNEIIADIEARISELLMERDGGNTQVVTKTDIARLMETLGSVEDIAGTDSEAETENTSTVPPKQAKASKRLYRDPDKRYLGGVCSGFGIWLGINPLFLRILFIAGIFFFWPWTVFIYIILWIIMPLAKTTAQKLEMRGEPVNISNIEKSVKETLSDSNLSQSFRQFLSEAGVFFGKIISIIARIFIIIFGLALFMSGIGIVVAICSLFFMQDFIFSREVEWDFFSFNELLQQMISPVSYQILSISFVIIVALIVFAFMFWGIKLMTGLRIKHRFIHFFLLFIWIGAIVACLITGFSEARNYTWHNETKDTKILAASDTLYLSAIPFDLKISNNPLEIYFDKDNERFYGKPNLRIYKSDDKQVRLIIEKESQGKNKLEAFQLAENIEYEMDIQGSTITFASYFTVIPEDQWKFQVLNLTLYVPEGTIIIADNYLCNDRLSRWFNWRYHPECCTWIMTEKKGLQHLDTKK